jgi:hypothetical protein
MARLVPEEHNISDDVWLTRPYVRWEQGCPGPVQDAYFDLQSGQKAAMRKVANQCGGYAITPSRVRTASPPHAQPALLSRDNNLWKYKRRQRGVQRP